MALPGLLTAALLAAPAGPDAGRLAVIRRMPDFALTTQDGATLRGADPPGRVLVVSFVFPPCNGPCPATTHRMSNLAQALEARGLLRDGRVRLLSIPLDPRRDTPAALRRYMQLYDADPAHWTFLTGPKRQVAKVIAAWGMWVRPGPGGQLDHPSRLFLVDRRGRIREIYSLEFFKPAWVLEDVRSLLD